MSTKRRIERLAMKLALSFDEITAASYWRKYWAYARARDHYIRVTIGADRYLKDRSVPRFEETEEGKTLRMALRAH
jgi:hypothetical protein